MPPPTVANPSALTHENTLYSGSLDARIGVKGCLRMGLRTDRATVCTLVRQVMAETGIQQKALALNAEQPESVISDALADHGKRHFALEWLCDQDDAFVLAFIERLLKARGLTPASKRAVVAERVGELVRLLLESAA